LTTLVLAHRADVLRFAVAALALIDVPEEYPLSELQALEAARERLEASTVSLLGQAGVSWEAMAQELGVRRQSLHRRLHRKSLAFQVAAQQASWDRLKNEWESLVKVLDKVADELSSADVELAAGKVADELRAGRSGR